QQLIDQLKPAAGILLLHCIHKVKHTLGADHIQGLEQLLVLDVAAAECYGLIQQSKSIAQSAVRLFGNNMQRFVINADILIIRYLVRMRYDILYTDALKVEALNARQDRRQ